MRKPFDNNWPLTQGFGLNPDMYKKFKLLGHNGLDYGLPTGTPVLAPHGGKVIEAVPVENDPLGYGNYLKIEDSIQGSVLAHLKSFSVKVGDTIIEGQQIGLSNNTGNSTGPHLHWGYYRFPRNRDNGYAGFIDQTPFLDSAVITQPIAQDHIVDANKMVTSDQNFFPQDWIKAIYVGILGVEPSSDELAARLSQIIAGPETILHDVVSQVLNEDSRSPLVKQISKLQGQITDLEDRLAKLQLTLYTATSPTVVKITPPLMESGLTKLFDSITTKIKNFFIKQSSK